MKLKLASALPTGVMDALEDLIKPLYSKPGMHIIGIVDLAHVERNQVAPDEDKEPSVTIGIKHLEIAHGEQVEHVRKALRALYVQRTATGTLDEDLQQIELAKSTMEDLSDDLALRETARLHAALKHVNLIVGRLAHGTFTEVDMRKQLAKLSTVVNNTLEWQEDAEDLQTDILKHGAGVVTA